MSICVSYRRTTVCLRWICSRCCRSTDSVRSCSHTDRSCTACRSAHTRWYLQRRNKTKHTINTITKNWIQDVYKWRFWLKFAIQQTWNTHTHTHARVLTQTRGAVRSDLVALRTLAAEAALGVDAFTSSTEQRVALALVDVWNTGHITQDTSDITPVNNETWPQSSHCQSHLTRPGQFFWFYGFIQIRAVS